jgi:carboxylesterase
MSQPSSAPVNGSDSLSFARFFQDPEHRTFLLEGHGPAAVLVHGFPGTPAEVRSLAETLHAAGWTVQGLLLPGFGPEIDSLAGCTYADWVRATRHAVTALRAHHCPTLLIGFSMGSAVAMNAATHEPADGLVLMAPFWKLGPLGALIPVMRQIFPAIQPFRLMRPDFSNPEVRKGINNFLPGLDLNDPQVQANVRRFTVPVGILDEVRKVGEAAGRAAPQIETPTLIIQGRSDPVVRAALTRRLAVQMPGLARYLEVSAAHDLLDHTKPAWPQITDALLAFGDEVERGKC